MEFSDGLIDAYAEVPELVSHVHLPVQCGSDRILAAMKRGHTVLEYKSKIRRLRQARPGISISSDFIVGFPGETEADFAATLALIEEIGFDQSFSFIYSRRPGTPAADYPDDVPREVKKERLARLQAALIDQAQAVSSAAWSAPCSGCWWTARRARTRANWPDAPRTTGWSTSTGPST